jgi:DNA-binding CsgD family transcriptional regulator
MDGGVELARQVRRLTVAGGLLVAIDDAQWLDEQSVELLRHLPGARGHRRPRLIMSVSARSPQSPLRPVDLIMSDPGVRVMTLGPLSPAAVSTLVGQCLGHDSHESFARACHEATEGIPALVLALVRELSTRRLSPSAETVQWVQKVTSRTVARSVLERLSRLPDDATLVLEAVAVAGDPAAPELIAAAAKLSSARVTSAARLLVAQDLVTLDSGLLRMTPISRRTVYEEIDLKQRAKMHLAVAAYLKARGASFDMVAGHLVATDPARRDWVAKELFESARVASAKGEASQALRFLRRAFAEQPRAWDDPAQLLNLVRVEMQVDSQAAVEHLLRSLDRGADPTQAAEVAHQLALRLSDTDIPAESYCEMTTALGSALERISEMLPPTERSVRIELSVVRALVVGTRLAPPATHALRCELDLGHPGTQAGHKAVALLAIADSVSPTRARASSTSNALRQVLLDAQLCSENPIDCQLWARALLALARSGEFSVADRFARHAQAMSQSRGLLSARADYCLTLAMSLSMQGAIVEAQQLAEDSLMAAQGRAWARRPDAVACLVGSLVDQGRWDEAETVLSRFASLEREISPYEGPAFLEQRGRLRGCQGRSSEALTDLLEAGGCADECGVDSPVVTTWRSEAALLLAKQGRMEDAAPLAKANLKLALAHGGTWVIGSALRVDALASGEEGRLAKLEEAVRLLEASPARLQLAIALTDLGEELRRIGEPLSSTRLILRRGLDIANRQHADPLVSRALAALRQSGARPRRTAVSGPASLTLGESRVVALAADGLSNAAIASTLFLAEKTVEGHLVRAYRKLGVRSRRELSSLLRPGAEEETYPSVAIKDFEAEQPTFPQLPSQPALRSTARPRHIASADLSHDVIDEPQIWQEPRTPSDSTSRRGA